MRDDQAVKRGALRYLAVLLMQRLIGLLLFILAAGTMMDLGAIAYFSLYFLSSIIAVLILYGGHQETLYERGNRQENTKAWDKVILPVYVALAYYGVYLAAGLGVRFGWPKLPTLWFYAGTALYLVSAVFTVWPVIENRHFESTARIQRDRAQTVVSTGPYRIVRHPGYLGILIWAIATALMFGTLAVGSISLAIIALIVTRTHLEDAMLKRELDGYLAYAAKVRYRLIPFIW